MREKLKMEVEFTELPPGGVSDIWLIPVETNFSRTIRWFLRNLGAKTGIITLKSEQLIKTGLMGNLAGYRLNGKSYDTEGREVEEIHEADCFCCRKDLFKGKLPHPQGDK